MMDLWVYPWSQYEADEPRPLRAHEFPKKPMYDREAVSVG